MQLWEWILSDRITAECPQQNGHQVDRFGEIRKPRKAIMKRKLKSLQIVVKRKLKSLHATVE